MIQPRTVCSVASGAVLCTRRCTPGTMIPVWLVCLSHPVKAALYGALYREYPMAIASRRFVQRSSRRGIHRYRGDVLYYDVQEKLIRTWWQSTCNSSRASSRVTNGSKMEAGGSFRYLVVRSERGRRNASRVCWANLEMLQPCSWLFDFIFWSLESSGKWCFSFSFSFFWELKLKQLRSILGFYKIETENLY